MRIAELFPSFVDVGHEEELIKEVSLWELEATIHGFQRDKSPRPDGWSTEFFLAFFDILDLDLLKVVEQCRLLGKIPPTSKSTFISLIPKSDKPAYFNDFQPISLCNYLYKIIAKILANRLKQILSGHISPEQFAFLQHHQIHEAIGTSQELLHSVHCKNLKGMILKVDLSKAFDRVNWLYIRLLLTHLGFPYRYIKWIMSCITDVSYSVLLNGSPTPLFMVERGLRQGFPLSPIIFLLIMEGVSRLIGAEHRGGRLVGIKIMDNCFLTHLLFVDDVLIFLNGSIGDTTALQHVFELFQKATGMIINVHKSTVMAVGYKIADSIWLISKVEKRMNTWYNRYLSRAGRLTLIKVVLEATSVYWMTLAWIPRGIRTRLQKSTAASFGKETSSVAAHNLSQPLDQCCLSKVLSPENILDWIQRDQRTSGRQSIIWKAVLTSLPLIRDGLTWQIHQGSAVSIGVDPWIGCGNAHKLSAEMIELLVNQGISHLSHIIDQENTTPLQQAWKSTRNLHIPGHWHQAWEGFTEALTQAHIRITEGEDEIVWAYAKNGRYSPKEGYLKLMEHDKPE
eukprot:PITA_03164